MEKWYSTSIYWIQVRSPIEWRDGHLWIDKCKSTIMNGQKKLLSNPVKQFGFDLATFWQCESLHGPDATQNQNPLTGLWIFQNLKGQSTETSTLGFPLIQCEQPKSVCDSVQLSTPMPEELRADSDPPVCDRANVHILSEVVTKVHFESIEFPPKTGWDLSFRRTQLHHLPKHTDHGQFMTVFGSVPTFKGAGRSFSECCSWAWSCHICWVVASMLVDLETAHACDTLQAEFDIWLRKHVVEGLWLHTYCSIISALWSYCRSSLGAYIKQSPTPK